MKRYLCAILILVTLLCVSLGCLINLDSGVAYAETDEPNDEQIAVEPLVSASGNILGVKFMAGERTVELYSIVDKGNYVGVRLIGDYFGFSQIPVTVDVYHTAALPLNFNLGYDNLTDGQIASRNKVVKLIHDISLMIDKVDDCANTTYDGSTVYGIKLPVSDVYRYNYASESDPLTELVEGGYRIQIAEDTYEMLKIAREMYDVTGGAFNPAVYRLVDLWGFSTRTYYNNGDLPYDRTWSEAGYPLPQQKYIDAFSNADFTDFSDGAATLSKEGGKFYVTKKVTPAVVDGVQYQQWIDLGGVAKGYVADKAREMIKSLGVDRYYVDAGRSSRAVGVEYDGGATTMPVEDSFNTFTDLFKLQLDPCSVSNSAQNIRKYTFDGVEYAHIIDGATGAPAQTGVRSVFLALPDDADGYWAAKGDCLTTALTIMGRDGLVKFINGYLKDNGIKVVAQYMTVDDNKQLLTNYTTEDIEGVSAEFAKFGWALKLDEQGNFIYDANATFKTEQNLYKWILIVLGCVFGVAAVALVVYHFVRGRKRVVGNVQNAKKDKPFKVPDVMVYLVVVLLVLVLFYVFVFDTDSTQLNVVNVVDIETGETLFVYNVTRGEYLFNDNNMSGWTVDVKNVTGGVEVTFTSELAGKHRVNTVQIIRGVNPSVRMLEANCSGHDCVDTFAAITRSGKGITCSPNRLKIVTE